MGWIEETLHEDFRFSLRVERVLYEQRSEHHHLAIVENGFFGRALYLDGVLQTTERDEFIYHEMLAHVPILAHGAARRVLIVGGGDGGMLEEVLKHGTVEHVTMVEIDRGVVDLCREHLPGISKGAFDDPRLDLVIDDGVRYLERTAARFDVVISDATDPIGPGAALFSDAFYAGAKKVLNPGGILVTQNGVPFVQPGELRTSIAKLRPLFSDVTCYLATVPGYVGGPMAFGWASDEAAHREVSLETLSARFGAAGLDTRYYLPEIHGPAFALPRYVRDLVA
ncbi:MAG TPA: polyamine aminopropyltransferase [Geminicoccaceae bacterium]